LGPARGRAVHVMRVRVSPLPRSTHHSGHNREIIQWHGGEWFGSPGYMYTNRHPQRHKISHSHDTTKSLLAISTGRVTLDSCLVTHRHLEHQANEEMDELHTPSPDQGPPGGVGRTRPTPRHHCSHHAKETRTLCSASWADKPVLWAPSCVRVWQSEHRNRKMRAPLTSCASWAVIVVVTLPLGSSVVEFCDPGCDVSAVWRRQHHSC
jgi:hypothetical protein